MAFKKTIAERLFKISKISNKSLTDCRICSPSVQTRMPENPNSEANIAPDPRDDGAFRGFFHKRATFSGDRRPMEIGENLMEKLKVFDFSNDRIRLVGLSPPAISKGLTVADARKLLLVAQLEMVKSRLRRMEKRWITFTEFVRICEEVCSDPEQAVRVANTLDESGTVIVLGNVVYHKPEQENE